MEQELFELIKRCDGQLEEEAVEEIWHFYNHDEFEMSLEGLLIELYTNKVYPKNYDLSRVIDIAKYYKLDKESIFDADIWSKILEWKHNNHNCVE